VWNVSVFAGGRGTAPVGYGGVDRGISDGARDGSWVTKRPVKQFRYFRYPIRGFDPRKVVWLGDDHQAREVQAPPIFSAFPCPEKARYSPGDLLRQIRFFIKKHWVHALCC
jgi:hypothetical protein